MLDAMAGRLELLRATERIHGAHGPDEGVAIVEGDLHFQPLDVIWVPLQLPRLDRLELIARHRRPAREVGRQQVLRVRDESVAVPESDRVAVPRVRTEHVLVFLTDVDAADRGTEVVDRSEEHTSELQSRLHLVCRLLLTQENK